MEQAQWVGHGERGIKTDEPRNQFKAERKEGMICFGQIQIMKKGT